MAGYRANRHGVRFGEHSFELGEEIPDSVRDQYPKPFDRAVARGWVSVGVEVGEPRQLETSENVEIDLSGATKPELQDAAERLGIDVVGTGTGGTVLKKDLIAALNE